MEDGWEKLCTNKQTNRQTLYENNGHLAVNQKKLLKQIIQRRTEVITVYTVKERWNLRLVDKATEVADQDNKIAGWSTTIPINW